MAKPQRNIKKSGPPPETLVITGIDWKEAVKRSFQKEKPLKGWPKRKSKRKPRTK
jgi:hypothetical protein